MEAGEESEYLIYDETNITSSGEDYFSRLALNFTQITVRPSFLCIVSGVKFVA